ncbi:hypothetical protein [Kiloniella laminariae]|uniref:hypothetical protein n=1 Tax=Kiloniella laminariae TaxID=454162 RepID=UPI00036F775C|nr:hypothetical protein [Kiloniella laminariae]
MKIIKLMVFILTSITLIFLLSKAQVENAKDHSIFYDPPSEYTSWQKEIINNYLCEGMPPAVISEIENVASRIDFGGEIMSLPDPNDPTKRILKSISLLRVNSKCARGFCKTHVLSRTGNNKCKYIATIQIPKKLNTYSDMIGGGVIYNEKCTIYYDGLCF